MSVPRKHSLVISLICFVVFVLLAWVFYRVNS